MQYRFIIYSKVSIITKGKMEYWFNGWGLISRARAILSTFNFHQFLLNSEDLL
jgi:hypothetical protein